MDINQARAKIQAKKTSIPPPPVTSNVSKAVDGEIVMDLNELDLVSNRAITVTVDEEDTQYESDLAYAQELLKQANDLLMYMATSKLSPTIEPVDRKEMAVMAREIRVFLHTLSPKKEGMNIGYCKHYISKSCLTENLEAKTRCSSCKKYLLQVRMEALGVVPEKAELTEREIAILERMEAGLKGMGVDI